MVQSLKRFWFSFESPPEPNVLSLGCGVTAFSYEDAVAILKARVFPDEPMPKIAECIENVDVSQLDAGHVLPNMAPPSNRGIWFPLGYE